MKSKGDLSPLLHLRNREIYETYKRITASCQDGIKMPDIMTEVVMSPSKRFWITEGRAMLAVTSMQKGVMPAKTDTRKRQYREIYRRVLAEKKLHPDLKLKDLVARVLVQPAPEFYILPRAAEFIVNKFRFHSNQSSTASAHTPTFCTPGSFLSQHHKQPRLSHHEPSLAHDRQRTASHSTAGPSLAQPSQAKAASATEASQASYSVPVHIRRGVTEQKS